MDTSPPQFPAIFAIGHTLGHRLYATRALSREVAGWISLRISKRVLCFCRMKEVKAASIFVKETACYDILVFSKLPPSCASANGPEKNADTHLTGFDDRHLCNLVTLDDPQGCLTFIRSANNTSGILRDSTETNNSLKDLF